MLSSFTSLFMLCTLQGKTTDIPLMSLYTAFGCAVRSVSGNRTLMRCATQNRPRFITIPPFATSTNIAQFAILGLLPFVCTALAHGRYTLAHKLQEHNRDGRTRTYNSRLPVDSKELLSVSPTGYRHKELYQLSYVPKFPRYV